MSLSFYFWNICRLNFARMDLEIKRHAHRDMLPAAAVVAQAMLHNPLHLAVFGAADEQAQRKQTSMFIEVLQLPQCNLFTAWKDGRMVGLMNYYAAGCCQITLLKTLGMLPGMFGILGNKLPGVLKWKANWAKHDPKERHLHFGPLAVLPSMQGNGIGSALLARFCVIADSHREAAYLETDKIENVALYERYGFRVIAVDTLFGVKNWFMWRDVLTTTK
jgi:ribosomal protein S18 acetylase RimI-like enzyme